MNGKPVLKQSTIVSWGGGKDGEENWEGFCLSSFLPSCSAGSVPPPHQKSPCPVKPEQTVPAPIRERAEPFWGT